MSIDRTGANAHFAAGNHIKAAIWEAFDEDQQTAAIAHAKRLLIRLMDDDLDEEATEDGDFPRHDLAVYEQACYMLQCNPIQADGQQAGPKFSMPDVGQKDNRQAPGNPNQLCEEALYWLVRGGQVTLSRG